MRPKGNPDNINSVEVAVGEFVLDPDHPCKELRGTKYFEFGSATLSMLTKLTTQYTLSCGPMDLTFWGQGTYKVKTPGSIVITGLLTGVKDNSLDQRAFIENILQNWRDKGYKIANMPPKFSRKDYQYVKAPIFTHGLVPNAKPPVTYAYMGSNNLIVRGSLARALYELDLIPLKDICIKDESGKWILANRWDYTDVINNEE